MPPTLIIAGAMLLQNGAMAASFNAILGRWRTDDGKGLVEAAFNSDRSNRRPFFSATHLER